MNIGTYWTRVKAHAQALRGDGCTDAPDFWFKDCCDEHDVAYRTHAYEDGLPISKYGADLRLRQCIQAHAWLGRFSPLSWIYWGAVRLLGKHAWKWKHNGEV